MASFSSPWPNPNSSILSKINFGVPVSEVLLWLQARDTFLGENGKKQDIMLALNLAQHCKHPDAVWLASIFEGKDVSTKEEAKEVFLLHQDDARALCFAWCLSDERETDRSLLCRSVDLGYAFACSKMCKEWDVELEDAFRLAQKAAAQHERDGFGLLGQIFLGKDLELAKENCLVAAELGSVSAAIDYGSTLEENDPARWVWFSKVAVCGWPASFFQSFPRQVEQLMSGSGNATVVFLIGRALKGNMDMEKKKIFGKGYNFDSLISPANQAVSFYECQISCARLAVDTWTLVATRMHIIKDIRVFIGKMIWEARFEANYNVSAFRAQKRSQK